MSPSSLLHIPSWNVLYFSPKWLPSRDPLHLDFLSSSEGLTHTLFVEYILRSSILVIGSLLHWWHAIRASQDTYKPIWTPNNLWVTFSWNKTCFHYLILENVDPINVNGWFDKMLLNPEREKFSNKLLWINVVDKIYEKHFIMYQCYDA